MNSAVLPDEDARRRIRETLDQNFLVEAGAGTGKTTLLVDRTAALVDQGRARLHQVVAITFTEKAAAELRVKVRERIERRLRELERASGAASADPASNTPETPGGAADPGVKAARARYREALADLELAPISTIHAFCAELLRERPVEAGVDPDFQVADELAASLFRTEAWDRWLARQKDVPDGPLRNAIEYGVPLGQLRKVGDVLLRYRDVPSADLDSGPPPPDPLEWLQRIEPELREFIAAAATCCYDPEDRAAQFLNGDLAQHLDILTRLDPIEARRKLLATITLRLTKGRQANWANGTLAAIKDRLATLQGELDTLRDTHGHWLAAGVARWLRGYVETYQALKAQEGLLDFDDLLLCTRDLLRDHPEVRRAFQRRFAAILVDEFQDTDPLQAEIIFFLAEDPDAPGAPAPAWDEVRLRPGALFIVGDPKQSIYAFRRADIETYERAKEVLQRSGTVRYITANFRSVQEILDGVNDLFREKMHRPPGEAYQPDYVALAPSPRTVPAAGPSPALLLLYPDAPEDEDQDMTAMRRREAEGLAAFLRHQIDGGGWQVRESVQSGEGPPPPQTQALRPVRFGDVALLFRGMADVPLYEEALARYDIPYRVTSSRTFYQREEVGWLLNVLHAVEHPTDPIAVWGALRSPCFGCSDREVYELVAGGGSLDYRAPLPWEHAVPDASPAPGTPAPGATALGAPAPGGPAAGAGSPSIDSIGFAYSVLRDLHRARLSLSVPAMVEEILERTQARLTFLLTHQGEQRVANLNKVVTLARALEESGILTFRAFVHWLRDMEEQAVDEAESPTVEEGDDVVRLMSIHAAKGLEFPVVVLPDLARASGGHADHVVLHRLTGRVGLSLGRVEDWIIHTREYEDLKEHHARREDAERLRLLYVGMTRARDALVVSVFPRVPARTLMADLDGLVPPSPRFGRAYRGWTPLRSAEFPRLPSDAPAHLRLPEAPAPAPSPEREAWAAVGEHHRRTAAEPEPVVHPSGLVDHDALVRLKQQGARLEAERGGRVLGDLVHRALAFLPPGCADLAEGVVHYLARQMNVSERLEALALSVVQRALTALPAGAIDPARTWREVPFVMAEGQAVVEGAIDLLVEFEDKVAAGDFKTDVVAPDGTRGLETLYASQLGLYARVAGEASGELVEARVIPLRTGQVGVTTPEEER